MFLKHLFKYVLFLNFISLSVFINISSVLAENLIQNEGFENGVDGWYTFGATISQNSDYRKTGSFSGKMQTTSIHSGTKYIYTVVPVVEGKNYRAFAFVIKQGEANANILLKVAFYQNPDGTGSQIDGISYSSPKINQNTLEFQSIETDTILTPAAATSARIRPSIEMPTGSTQNGIVYLDEVKFEEVNTSSPSPSPTPTPILAPTLSPTPKSTSSFTISGIPPQINSNQSFEISVDLILPNNKNTDYYLSGAFKKVDGARYFGFTKINSSWVQYSSSNYLNQYKITTDNNGNWAGTLEVKPDTEDSDYKGAGDYTFKVARYSSNSNPSWSNESTINIAAAISTPQASSTLSPSSLSPIPSNSNSLIPPRSLNPSSRPVKIATVAGAVTHATYSATPSSQISIKNQKQTNPIVWIGLFFIFAGIGSIGYIYLKSNGKIPFKFRR